MKISLQRWTSLAGLGLMVVSLSSTGCKTGWKMPGKDMFAWGKKPSESTLAGQGPSTTYPTSPATTNTPSQIASGGRPSSTGYAANGTSTPNFSPTSSYAATGYPKPTAPTSPGMGGAATANGYQTGPYGMSSGQASGANAYAGMSTPANPYGTAPTSSYGAPQNQFAGQTPPSIQSYGGAGSPGANTYRPAGASLASTGQGTGAPTTSFAAPTSGYAMPNAYPPAGVANAYATTQATAPAGAGTPASYTPSPSNPYGAAGSVYRPGSTSRPSSYDFAQPGSTAQPSGTYAGAPTSGAPGTVPQFSAPSSVPMTANGYNNPGYAPSSTPSFAPPPGMVR